MSKGFSRLDMNSRESYPGDTVAGHLVGFPPKHDAVFNVPGVARYLVTALTQRDYPIVQNLVMFVATIVVLINFAVDMLYAVLDPRIKYS